MMIWTVIALLTCVAVLSVLWPLSDPHTAPDCELNLLLRPVGQKAYTHVSPCEALVERKE